MSKKTLICGFDTETDHNTEETEAWIAQWAICVGRDRTKEKHTKDGWVRNTDMTVYTGYTLDALMEQFERMINSISTQYIVYAHNLNYDFAFLRSAFAKLVESAVLKEQEEELDPMSAKAMLGYGALVNDHEGCFMIAPNGGIVMFRMGSLELRDSSKKVPAGTTVKQMGNMIGLPKLESPRGAFYPGWSADLTDEDFQYVIRDAEIVMRFTKKLHEVGSTHPTISSDAFASAKAIFNKYHNRNGYGLFNEFFPQLDYNTDSVIREGYAGGINIGQHIGLNHGDIVALDVNSMYPTVMMYDLLPYGKPIEVDDPSGYDLWMVRAKMKFHLKEGMIAVFKFKRKEEADMEGMERTSEGVRDCKCWHTLTLTNVDIENYSRFYDIEIQKGSAVYLAFNAARGLMKEYIEHWFEVKRVSPKGSVERDNAKLMLNSLYGRFGISPEMTEPMFTWSEDIGDVIIKSVPSPLDVAPGYLPYAVFVTANARRRLCDGILTVGCDNVIHCDTDSVKYIGGAELSKSLGHTDALGDWKIEDTPSYMVEGGVKRYVELSRYPVEDFSDILAFTCAGMPQKMEDGCPVGMWVEVLDDPMRICETGRTFGDKHYRIQSTWLREMYKAHGIDPDDVNTMKLLRTAVKGGVILKETNFIMHDMMIIRMR